MATKERQETTPPQNPWTHRILIVDDDAEIRDLLRSVLEDEGYNVLTAIDGREALALMLDPNNVNVILLDMRMPTMDGWQFARAYAAQVPPAPPAPIIVITAAQDARTWARQIGAAAYLGKPFKLTEVRRVVRGLLP